MPTTTICSVFPPDMPPAPQVLGAIIAGGAARRFGGDKGAAPFAGRALIDHARHVLAPMVDKIVIVGRDWNDLLRIDDLPGPGLGPVGGIAGSLAYAWDNGFAVVLTIGCDTPLVAHDFLQRLLEQAPAYCADNPVIGAWPAIHAARAARFVANDRKRSVRGWAAAIDAVPIACPGLANLNTPEDLVRWERE